MRAAICTGFLLAMLCVLLAVATSASAECAWVLWMQRNGVYQPPSAAFPAIGECDRELESLASNIRSVEGKYHGYEVTLGPHRMSGVSLKKGNSVVYTCLPDTIDPRGPKGTK